MSRHVHNPIVRPLLAPSMQNLPVAHPLARVVDELQVLIHNQVDQSTLRHVRNQIREEVQRR